MSETTPARATSNQSTEKAFAVLELLSEAQGPMRLRDISTDLSMLCRTAAMPPRIQIPSGII